jgi:hypothetical protein
MVMILVRDNIRDNIYCPTKIESIPLLSIRKFSRNARFPIHGTGHKIKSSGWVGWDLKANNLLKQSDLLQTMVARPLSSFRSG